MCGLNFQAYNKQFASYDDEVDIWIILALESSYFFGALRIWDIMMNVFAWCVFWLKDVRFLFYWYLLINDIAADSNYQLKIYAKFYKAPP